MDAAIGVLDVLSLTSVVLLRLLLLLLLPRWLCIENKPSSMNVRNETQNAWPECETKR
jgi:hypothetical protein